MSQKLKQIAVIFIIIFIGQGIIKGLNTTKTIVIRNAQADVEEYIPTPCGLREVKCEGEDTVELSKNKPLEGSNSDDKHIVALIAQTFPEDSATALAVMKAESGGNATSMNWNCRYNGVSQTCRAEDRDQAWSVDCGLMQINTLGKVCPEELFDPQNNLKIAKSMYASRGWNPWVSYWSGGYLKFK